MCGGDMDWIYQGQNKDKWRGVLLCARTEINLSQRRGIFIAYGNKYWYLRDASRR